MSLLKCSFVINNNLRSICDGVENHSFCSKTYAEYCFFFFFFVWVLVFVYKMLTVKHTQYVTKNIRRPSLKIIKLLKMINCQLM